MLMTSSETGYMDIHSHILHGVDDGAESIEVAKRMLRLAHEEGIKIIFATPHFYTGRENIKLGRLDEKLEELRAAAGEIAPDLQIVTGNELFYSEDIVDALKSGLCRRLGPSRYVLVEFHPSQAYSIMRQGLYGLLTVGCLPVLAHAERYLCLREKTAYIDDLIQMGVYIQVNAESVVGRSGLKTARYVRRILRDECVHFIATDSHDDVGRAPRLRKCVEYLCRKHGMEYARQLLWENPMKILRDEYV